LNVFGTASSVLKAEVVNWQAGDIALEQRSGVINFISTFGGAMSFNIKNNLYLSAFLLLAGSAAQATTLYVNCGAKTGLTTINAAINVAQHLESRDPTTINVSGACRENILVQNMDRVTISAINGASITDASGGTHEVIDVLNSRSFTLNGFTIVATCPSSCLTGAGADGISCYYGSDCLLINNTVSGAGNGAGIGVYSLSKAIVQGGLLQNNWAGLFTNDSGQMFALGVTTENNAYGMYMNRGGTVSFRAGADGVTPTVISHNSAQGIFADIGATVVLKAPADVSNNGIEGIFLGLGAKLFAGGGTSGVVSMTSNGSPGVRLKDLAIAQFGGNAQITGNKLPNVWCDAATAVTSNAIAAAGGSANTNCNN
jgi:hypothetical protein